ncbi:hypothetical protein OAO18_05530 [Francisellaceae bacterium]|nr:hypothetical protein [Francisellaceae bacterium]
MRIKKLFILSGIGLSLLSGRAFAGEYHDLKIQNDTDVTKQVVVNWTDCFYTDTNGNPNPGVKLYIPPHSPVLWRSETKSKFGSGCNMQSSKSMSFYINDVDTGEHTDTFLMYYSDASYITAHYLKNETTGDYLTLTGNEPFSGQITITPDNDYIGYNDLYPKKLSGTTPASIGANYFKTSGEEPNNIIIKNGTKEQLKIKKIHTTCPTDPNDHNQMTPCVIFDEKNVINYPISPDGEIEIPFQFNMTIYPGYTLVGQQSVPADYVQVPSTVTIDLEDGKGGSCKVVGTAKVIAEDGTPKISNLFQKNDSSALSYMELTSPGMASPDDPESLFYAVGDCISSDSDKCIEYVDTDKRSTWVGNITLNTCGEISQKAEAKIFNLTNNTFTSVNSNSSDLLVNGVDKLENATLDSFSDVQLSRNDAKLPENYDFGFDVNIQNQSHHYDVKATFIGENRGCKVIPSEYHCNVEGDESNSDIAIYQNNIQLLQFKQSLAH